MIERYKYLELTGRIMGAAIEVHRHLGNGFQEVVYQRALAIELELQGVCFEREKEMPLTYKSHDIGTRRVDFLLKIKSCWK